MNTDIFYHYRVFLISVENMEPVLFIKEAIASPWKPGDTLLKSAPELSYCSCPLFQAIRPINKNKFKNTHFLPLSLKKKYSLA